LRGAHTAGLRHLKETGEGPILGQRIELPGMRSDGSEITIELAVVPIPGSDPPLYTGHVRDISQRRAFEERLRLLESVAVNANDAVLITEAVPFAELSENGEVGPRIIYANETFLNMTGYGLTDVIGESPLIFQGPGTSARSRARIRNALKKMRSVVVETLNYKKDGTPFWIELSLTPIANEQGTYTHWVSIQRDITERKKTLDALRESQQRFQGIAANVPGMVYELKMTPDGHFSFPFVNEGCREIYHLEPEPILRDAGVIMNCIHPDHAQDFSVSIMTSAQTMQPWEWEGRILLPGETTKWVRGNSRPTRQEDGSIVWDGIIFDVTQHKVEEEQLQSARIEAEHAREEAERANLAKSEFLSRMSHELRTPLNAILGFGQLLEMSDLKEEDAQSTEQIIKAGRHLLNLINEVLDIARIESGKLAISSETVGAGELALEVMDLVRPLAATRSITIDDHQARESKVHLTADRQRLKQILLNLVSNSVKYNHEGGKISFSIQEVDDRVRLSVSDNGPGIRDEDVERLWLPFERLGAENSGIEGTGVGLAVSQQLAKAMGTILRVQSEVGRGSVFSIDLPRAEDPHAVHHEAAEEEVMTMSSTRFVVLYIEDNPSNLHLVQRLLSRRPEIRLLSAMQGELGYELARMHCPDLILLDLHLPDVSGLEVLLRLQGNTGTKSIPIVVLSADATPGQARRAVDAGAKAYLTKPLEVRQFFDTLDRILIQNGDENGMKSE
ncbi:PAS domain S-box protein, partial [bacterium]